MATSNGLSPNFQSAVAYLSNAPSLSKVSSTVKLELYGLFKYLTVSSTPVTPRPSIFDMTGRAKWDAWTSAGQKYQTAVEAEMKYLEIARSLGWTEGVPSVPEEKAGEGSKDSGWDDDSDSETSGDSGGGMGVFVSALEPPPAEVDDGSLHAAAVRNDVASVLKYFEDYPRANVDELDDHGYTPLHLACDRGNVAAVQALLLKGANAAIKDPDDFTPLELARIAGHEDVEAVLLQV